MKVVSLQIYDVKTKTKVPALINPVFITYVVGIQVEGVGSGTLIRTINDSLITLDEDTSPEALAELFKG